MKRDAMTLPIITSKALQDAVEITDLYLRYDDGHGLGTAALEQRALFQFAINLYGTNPSITDLLAAFCVVVRAAECQRKIDQREDD